MEYIYTSALIACACRKPAQAFQASFPASWPADRETLDCHSTAVAKQTRKLHLRSELLHGQQRNEDGGRTCCRLCSSIDLRIPDLLPADWTSGGRQTTVGTHLRDTSKARRFFQALRNDDRETSAGDAGATFMKSSWKPGVAAEVSLAGSSGRPQAVGLDS